MACVRGEIWRRRGRRVEEEEEEKRRKKHRDGCHRQGFLLLRSLRISLRTQPSILLLFSVVFTSLVRSSLLLSSVCFPFLQFYSIFLCWTYLYLFRLIIINYKLVKKKITNDKFNLSTSNDHKSVKLPISR